MAAAFTVPEDRKTFELPGESPGVLLIHGFTGDTREMRPLARRINQLGLHCYAPLLPGHGGPPHLMAGITAQVWQDAVRQGLAYLRSTHDRVIVVGFSMGGALAAAVLADDPVLAFVAIAPMISIRNPLLPFAPFAKYVFPWFHPLRFMSIDTMGIRDELLAFDPTLKLDDPDVLDMLRREVRFPVAVAAELPKIVRRALAAAKRLTTPTLVIQGDADLTLYPGGAQRFYNAIPAHKELAILPTAGHDVVKAGRPMHSALLSIVERWIHEQIRPR
ncbi:MAG: alpha/beta fold hydrolase [Anaerolineae bacterium]|nr:alpha/beta fold hydrolase [Anaerolineae bacterium]